MIDIVQIESGNVVLKVDTTIYDNWVIDKVLYWLSADFNIFRRSDIEAHIQIITLEPKDKETKFSLALLKGRLSNDFIDYKNRETINRETANIRDLLFAKAFANSDDFVEFTFTD